MTMSYLLYMVVGWLLHTQETKKLYRIVLYILAIMGLLLHMFGTYFLSMRDGNVNGTYKGYNNVPCILYSIGVFLFLKQIGPKVMRVKWTRKVVTFLNQYTFGVYLIHWFVLTAILRFVKINTTSISWRLIAPFGIVAISIGIICIIRKIPILRRVIP